jgi:putative copper resistance protein D
VLRRFAPLALVLLGAVAIGALAAGLAIGGGAEPGLIEDVDPGVFVRYGAPVASLASNLAAALTLGTLVLACFGLSKTEPEFERAMRLASWSAAIWTLANLAAGILSFAELIGAELRADDSFGAGLWQFVTTTEPGTAWGLSTAFAALVSIVVTVARGWWMLALATALSVAALVPIAGLGHQGGTADHTLATSAMFIHILFAAVWLGGLAAVAWLRPALDGDRQRLVVERFSSIALLCFAAVALSGVISAGIRTDGFAGIWSPYGALVLVKSAAILGLGLLGAVNRSRAIRRLPSKVWFWWIVVAELILMGVASGVASALSTTATPIPTELAGSSPAELLTGRPLPPPPTAEAYLFGFQPDPVWIMLCAIAIGFYVAGVVRLRRRGDRWPWLRVVSWVSGILVLAWITSGGINAYQDLLFSSHMLAHMVLGMMVPVLLVPGAPITLAMRAIKARHDGSRGPREWLMSIVHSWYFRIVGNAYVAAAIFVGSLWVFYYTPLFRFATTSHIGHQWMIVHFLFAGYLFVQALIGIDPAPGRPPYPIRLLLLLVAMAFHAFFGLALMTGTGLLLADWFGAMGWDLPITAIEDQQRAGGIAWSVGELPTLAVAIAVAMLWARSDDREQRRYDRKADRDGDAELEAYNRMLQQRAQRR